MNRISIVLISSLLMPTLANAACMLPEKPKFADPKTASPEVAAKLDVDMQRYATATNNYVACLSKEASDAQADAAKTITTYNNNFLAVYNKRTQ